MKTKRRGPWHWFELNGQKTAQAQTWRRKRYKIIKMFQLQELMQGMFGKDCTNFNAPQKQCKLQLELSNKIINEPKTIVLHYQSLFLLKYKSKLYDKRVKNTFSGPKVHAIYQRWSKSWFVRYLLRNNTLV